MLYHAHCGFVLILMKICESKVVELWLTMAFWIGWLEFWLSARKRNNKQFADTDCTYWRSFVAIASCGYNFDVFLSFTVLLLSQSFFFRFIYSPSPLFDWGQFPTFPCPPPPLRSQCMCPYIHQCLKNRCWQEAGILSGKLRNAVCLPRAQEDTGGQCKSITSSLSSLIGLRTEAEVCSGADGLDRPICLQCGSRCEAQTLNSHTTYFVSLPLKQTILPQFLLTYSWLDKFNGR